ncbi:MAG: hypothetical protein P8Y47_02335 [Alphaproteobacteria bacterium]
MIIVHTPKAPQAFHTARGQIILSREAGRDRIARCHTLIESLIPGYKRPNSNRLSKHMTPKERAAALSESRAQKAKEREERKAAKAKHEAKKAAAVTLPPVQIVGKEDPAEDVEFFGSFTGDRLIQQYLRETLDDNYRCQKAREAHLAAGGSPYKSVYPRRLSEGESTNAHAVSEAYRILLETRHVFRSLPSVPYTDREKAAIKAIMCEKVERLQWELEREADSRQWLIMLIFGLDIRRQAEAYLYPSRFDSNPDFPMRMP